MQPKGYGPALTTSDRDYWQRRGFKLMRASLPGVFTYFTDFADGGTGWTRVASTGTVRTENSTSTSHSWYQIQTGASSSSVPRLDLGDSSGSQYPSITPGGATGAFYIAYRFDTGIAHDTTNTTAALILRDPAAGTTRATLGKVAGAGNWQFTADTGSAIDTGVSVDTSAHVLEAVRPVGVSLTYVYVDGVLKASGNTYPSAPGHASLVCWNGSEAAVHQLMVDWVCVMGAGRPSYA